MAGSLFDTDWYRERYLPARSGAFDPLWHYVREGDALGHNPSLYFERDLYLGRAGNFPQAPITALSHFLLFGRLRRISPSPWFDYRWYLTKNPDVAIAHIEPFRHFIDCGLAENRSASPNFDPRFYLSSTPEAAGGPALAHYLRHGRDQGRATVAPDQRRNTQKRQLPRLPDDLEAAIRALPPISGDGAKIDVIVPVYAGFRETLSCLWHVLKARNTVAFDLVVIDDCSPEPALSEALQRLAADGYFRLLVNQDNLGFVATANRGMSLNPGRDIVLLNSDTEVYGNWLDRLAAVAQSPRCASVTPLTNSGTICGYPYFCEDTDGPLELDFSTLDALASAVNPGVAVEAPTGVGFCMYMRREAIDAVGPFDEKAFGRGYGEENDFCQRAEKAGFTNLITANIFVRHLGSTSFGRDKAGRVAQAMRILAKRYPDYEKQVQAFIEADPLADARAALDLARLTRFSKERNVLIISHSRGGGTEQHIQEDIRRLQAEGAAVFRMERHGSDPDRVELFHEAAPDVPNLPKPALSVGDTPLLELWDALKISEIHVHHLADFGADGATRLARLLKASKIPFQFTAHDYMTVCPRINLAGPDGYYCGEPDSAGCQQCLQRHGSEFGAPDIVRWRDDHRRLLSMASSVFTPSENTSRRLQRYFPDVAFITQPHEQVSAQALRLPSRASGHRLRVGLLGAIAPIKGQGVLMACARNARERRLPLDFIVIGYTADDERARAAGIEVTGAYRNEALLEIIERERLDLIFLPSTWPETWSYTLSKALESGLPVAAFKIGAPGERLQEHPDRAVLLDLSIARSPGAINDELLSRIGVLSSVESRDESGAQDASAGQARS